MKKIISVLLILCVAAGAFAADKDIVFKGITGIDNRSPAMGGSHVADTSDYFTLLRNPAGLAFSGRHNLVSQTNINIGGPISEVTSLLSGGDMSNAMGFATDLISENKLNLALTIGGPIAFGGTYSNGFGWGLFDQIIVGAVAPSTVIKVNAEIDTDLVFGYGHSFTINENHKIAVGVSTDLYAQTPYLKVQKNLMDLLGGGDIVDQLTGAMVLNSSIGANVDAGIQWEGLGFMSAGLVWNNFLSTVKSSTPVVDIDNLDPSALLSFDSDLNTYVGKGSLDIGVGFDIPTSWSLGIISEWTAYADMRDIVGLFKNDPLERNPILNLGIGTEATLLKCISLRAGINDSYLNAGIGIKLLAMHIDFSAYGKELGMEPGSTPQMNCALSIGFRH